MFSQGNRIRRGHPRISYGYGEDTGIRFWKIPRRDRKIEKLEKEGAHYIIVNLKDENIPSYHMVFLSNENIAPSFFGVLNTFAEVVSLYLREYHLHQKYRELALKDPLTEAYSRHYFNEWIFSHMAWLRRNQKKSILVIMDVDGLKMINDTYGHLMGTKHSSNSSKP